ncbi:MAG: sirohydrochlorin cobaltochelatase [Thermodesulfobacteriota bacterium]
MIRMFHIVSMLIAAALVLASAGPIAAQDKNPSPGPNLPQEKKAVVLAAFGTTHSTGLKPFLEIKAKVEKACPGTPVRLAFTANAVRQVWQKRLADQAWLKANPGVPQDVLNVKTPLAAIAELQNEGRRLIAVQSLHIYAGEEYADLKSVLEGLASMRTLKPKLKPFQKLALGRPALGEPGVRHPYQEDIAAAVKAVQLHLDLARQNGSALVYMGHGNEHYSTGVYVEFLEALRAAHPDVPVFLGCVEGFPGLDAVTAGLKESKARKAILLPFMLVAGDHAAADMCGDEADSWKTALKKAGLEVNCRQTGLGELAGWQDLFVRHLLEAMQDEGF